MKYECKEDFCGNSVDALESLSKSVVGFGVGKTMVSLGTEP